MDFVIEYGMFFAKLATIAIFVAIAVGIILLMFMRSKTAHEEQLEVKNLNEKYENMSFMLNLQIMDKKDFKQLIKTKKQEQKKKAKSSSDKKTSTVFVLNFKGDIKASSVSSLREEITAILNVAGDNDEVFVILESSGGTVHGYGLGASQLKRIRDKGIKLTVSVDKVAASGGYMMACVANKIISAPFAIVGSIGLLAQIPNFNRLLKKHDIDFEQLSSGEYKRTLTLFGENTRQDREKFQQELEEAHILFKDFIKEYRENADIDKISTGEHWYGKQALELNLVDELCTSDDYLLKTSADVNIFELRYTRKKPIAEKIVSFGARLFDEINQ